MNNIVINLVCSNKYEIVGVLIDEIKQDNDSYTLIIRKSGSITNSLFNKYKIFNMVENINYVKINRFGITIYMIIKDNSGDTGLLKYIKDIKTTSELELKRENTRLKGDVKRLSEENKKLLSNAENEVKKKQYSEKSLFNDNSLLGNRDFGLRHNRFGDYDE